MPTMMLLLLFFHKKLLIVSYFEAIEKLIELVKAKYIILSYSSGGRATAEELSETLNRSGTLLETIEIDYKMNVMADMKWTNEWTRDASKPNREFLFLMEK